MAGKPANASGNPSKAERDLGVIIYDKKDPYSVYNLVPDKVQNAMDSLPGYLKEYGEKGLDNSKALDVKDYQLRLAFWREYNYALQVKKKISITAVCRGICNVEYFYNRVLKSMKKFAWVLYPPSDYMAYMEEMHDLAMREMRDILRLPHKVEMKDKGRKQTLVDHKLIAQKIKIWNQVEARLKGLPVKKFQIDQNTRSLNLNYSKTEAREVPIKGRDQMKSMAELDAELARLESEVDDPAPQMLDAAREDNLIDVDYTDAEEDTKEQVVVRRDNG